jgi:hypothetical protein
MKKIFAAAAMFAAVFYAGAAAAQVEEVVVTGERRDDGSPHIYMAKRADHLITTVRVTCDTRDEKQRHEELKQTLHGMIAAARASKMLSLGIGDATVGELDESDLDDQFSSDSRPDTSQISVVIKTDVSKSDTLKSATGRIKDFIAKTMKVGRVEIIHADRWDLTVIGPEQYRDALMSKIVADAKHTAELFGSGYGITVEELERPVTWNQIGPLDLALYIPYTLHIAPGR